jgi:hypothetical protein
MMTSQYTQAIGYVPVGGNPPDDQRFSQRMRVRPIDRPIDRAIRASRIDRTFRQSIDRAGRAVLPVPYRASTIRSPYGYGALGQEPDGGGIVSMLWGLAALVSSGACAYHGYKRNNSVGWAIAWGFLGGLAPVITPAVALAQGYAEPKKG